MNRPYKQRYHLIRHTAADTNRELGLELTGRTPIVPVYLLEADRTSAKKPDSPHARTLPDLPSPSLSVPHLVGVATITTNLFISLSIFFIQIFFFNETLLSKWFLFVLFCYFHIKSHETLENRYSEGLGVISILKQQSF